MEVLFGKDDWVNRLVDLARCHPIRHRPTEATIEQEVLAIMPELAPAPTPASPQVVIHRTSISYTSTLARRASRLSVSPT